MSEAWRRWPWYDLSGQWERLRAVAQQRDRQKRGYLSTCAWNPDSHFVGLLGEAVYGLHVGQVPDLALRVNGAPDEDFPGVEVKAVSGAYWRDPYLKHPPAGPWAAAVFVLVAIDEAMREGAVCGQATRAALRAAPLRDWGHGPQRTLHHSALEPASARKAVVGLAGGA